MKYSNRLSESRFIFLKSKIHRKDRVFFVSRTHPGLVKRLFESEVAEVKDGTVEIKSIAREAGSRTKIAVWSPTIRTLIRLAHVSV